MINEGITLCYIYFCNRYLFTDCVSVGRCADSSLDLHSHPFVNLARPRAPHNISSYTGGDGGGGCYYEATSHWEANPPCGIQAAKTSVPMRINQKEQAHPVHDGNEASFMVCGSNFRTYRERERHKRVYKNRSHTLLLRCALLAVTCCQHGRTRFPAHALAPFPPSLILNCLRSHLPLLALMLL